MSPDEVAEYAGEALSSFGRVALVLSGLTLILIPVAGFYPAIMVVIMLMIGASLWARRRFRPPELRVQIVPTVQDQYVDWAEFLPDGSPWTIEGEPADWRLK